MYSDPEFLCEEVPIPKDMKFFKKMVGGASSVAFDPPILNENYFSIFQFKTKVVVFATITSIQP